ncbi:MAG TPA: isoaspartyl peptidase/L-asparaginase [Caulobacteraceae bacterium]|jgi:isoaspartyl peptidase/L-asparaginase-like protein (Ntn-hydrolase superfamily)|nr:isoaspartyl peptidase/L-asparaginase [Caulobacteraceae bacterium]
MASETVALALHGGAGVLPQRDYSHETRHMRALIEAGRDRLRAGAAAMDVMVEVIEALEASGLYVAGRGASPNRAGVFELDASVMDGPTQGAGAVAALVGIASPIKAARAVLETSGHVLLAGEGAAVFAREQGLAQIENPQTWFVPAWRDAGMSNDDGAKHGTVGCVALDARGALAAGTSTGGTFRKLPGRVGDTPIPGAGVWADGRVAVSCTGQGEMFIRAAVASQIAARLRFTDQSLAQACEAALADVGGLGGDGGLIALNACGEIATPFITPGMKRAWCGPDGAVHVAVFADEEAP